MFNRTKSPLLCLILTTLVTIDALYVQQQNGKDSKDSDKNSIQIQNANAHKYTVTGKGILNGGKTAQDAHNGNSKTAGSSLYQGSGTGHRASQFGAVASGHHTASNNAATRSSNGGKEHEILASKNMGSKSGSSSRSLKKKNHKKDYILNDSIHYGFDKNFNQEQTENGVYKLNKHLDAKQLANHHDRHRKYKTRRGQSDTSSRSLGSQRGLKESAQNAFNGDNSSRFGDFKSKQNAKSKNGAKSSIFGSQYNYKAGGNGYSNKKGDRLGRSQSSSNLKTSKQGTSTSRFGEQQHGGSDFVGPYSKIGLTHRGGSRGHKLSSGQGYRSSDAKGVGVSRALSNRDSKFRSGAFSDFTKNRNSGDDRNVSSTQSESQGDSMKRNREHHNSGKFKNASKRNFADASRFHNSNDSSRQKLVNIEGGENTNKDYKNKVKNKKVSKVFHTSKKVIGDNYERLDFDRKKLEKDRAKDSSSKSSNTSKFSKKFRNTNNKAKHQFKNKDNAGYHSKSTGQADRFYAAKEGNKKKNIQNKFGSHGEGDYSFSNSGQGFQKFGLKQEKSGSGNHASRQQMASSNSEFDNSALADHRVFGNRDHRGLHHLNSLNIAPSSKSRLSMPHPEPNQPNTYRNPSKIYLPQSVQSSSSQTYLPQPIHSQRYHPQSANFQRHQPRSKQSQTYLPQPIHSQRYHPQSAISQRYQPRSKQSQTYLPQTVYSQRYHPQSVNSKQYKHRSKQSQTYLPQTVYSQRYHPQNGYSQRSPSHRSSPPKYQPQTVLYQRQPSSITGQMGYQLERSSSVYKPHAEYQPRNVPQRIHESPSFTLPSFGVPSQNGGNSFSSFHHPFQTPNSHTDMATKSTDTRSVSSERFPKGTNRNETPKFHGGFEQMSVSNVFAESFFSPNMF